MKLRGQIDGNEGYAMAVLLVSLSVMAIMLTVAMPVWKHIAQREKEAELVFRGQQYVHAIGLFQRKHGPGVLPPNVDALLNEHYLRKKFKDPITNDDFQILIQGQATATTPGGATTGRGAPTGRGTTTLSTTPQPGAQPAAGQSGQGGRGAGVIGVASKSSAQSIRIYNGRTHYNEWAFMFTPTVQSPGGVPGQRQGGPGQRQGGPGQRPGGPGPVTGPGGSPFTPFGPGRGAPPNAPPGGRGRGRGGV